MPWPRGSIWWRRRSAISAISRLRALAVLRGVDRIYCEDTPDDRAAARPLRHQGAARTPITTTTPSAMRPAILAALRRGERVALVTDAGTPLISDPGLQAGPRGDRRKSAGDGSARPVGGADRADPLRLAARHVSVRRLSAATRKRRGARRWRRWAALEATLVFYEAPPRLAASLADMQRDSRRPRPPRSRAS